MKIKQLQETIDRLVKEAFAEQHGYEDQVASGDMSLRDMAIKMAAEEGIDISDLNLDQVIDDLEGFTPGGRRFKCFQRRSFHS